MNERAVLGTFFIPGTLTANHSIYFELPFIWTLLGVKASAVNDSDATLALSGGATVSATAIGDGDPTYIQPDVPTPISANELLVLTLDYDGSSGTAAQQVSLLVMGLIGE